MKLYGVSNLQDFFSLLFCHHNVVGKETQIYKVSLKSYAVFLGHFIHVVEYFDIHITSQVAVQVNRA